MTNENYKKLRDEIDDLYEILSLYANSEKGIEKEDFNKFFPMWCNKVSGGFPLQISINMIINHLDNKHNYVNKN